MKRFGLYLLRWQMSTPILALCVSNLPIQDTLIKTIIANLIGGILFFFIDKMIFTEKGGKNNEH